MTSISLEENPTKGSVAAVSDNQNCKSPGVTALKAILVALLVAGAIAAVGTCAVVLGTNTRSCGVDRPGQENDRHTYIESDDQHTQEDLSKRVSTKSFIAKVFLLAEDSCVVELHKYHCIIVVKFHVTCLLNYNFLSDGGKF